MTKFHSICLLFTLCLFHSHARSQCTETISLNTQLYGDQSASFNFNLDELASVENIEVSMFWTTSGGVSWPADLVLAFDSPDGGCVYFWDYANQAIPGCTGYGPAFPGNWSTTAAGNYSFTASTTNGFGVDEVYPDVLNGSGLWTITLLNTWTPTTWANYNMTITLTGDCAGDCFIQNACNYNPDAELIDNDNCIFATDIYPSGLYDCDGNCYLDFDGDGICNALEVPGCSEPWACNYIPNATDPPLPDAPCSYPDNNAVDCDGNSLLPQFLTQPQNITVSCDNIPESPGVSAQPAPAAVAYYGLFPESCYDAMDDVEFSFTENVYPGDCPGNYTIDRYWVITDCNGLQNAILQTITVVDNLPPVVLIDLTPDTLDCNDPVFFPPLQAEDICGGDWSVVGEPSFVFLPGGCEGESVQKKFTTIIDECGNDTEVEQVLLIEDNDPPYWLELEEPLEQIFTDNLDGEVFDVPVADDVCSNFEVNMTTTYNDGLCPLSVVLTRTFVATDQCGNTSAPFIQTITEETDLQATLGPVSSVTCHNGNDGSAEVSFSGGVAPYTVDWNGYNPSALPAGVYSAEVLDANLCSVIIDDILITQPPPFTLALEAIIPECTDPQSGQIIADVNGGTGEVSMDWNDINPDAVMAGTYSAVATDEVGCTASAEVTVAPAEIPESLELNGDTEVVQGDSAAYYYEYTLGSTYEWWYSGALEEQELASFAISVLWDTSGSVCVRETNQEGCVGDSVCVDVTVLDDVWSVGETAQAPSLFAFPNPASDIMTIEVSPKWVGRSYVILNSLGAYVGDGRFDTQTFVLDVKALPAGQYLLLPESGIGLSFQVARGR